MGYPSLSASELNQYFSRIGFHDAAHADLATLQTLHRLHPQAIAFESLDSWCGRTPSLVPAEVFAKLASRRRGGYCFEQNQLFLRVLLTLGFRVQTLAARVLMPDRLMPRTHMVLLVDLGATQWLADVGFGGMTMTGPLQVHRDDPQPTPHEPWRVQAHEDEFEVSAMVDGNWTALFRFGMARHIAEDYDMANWVVANHPASRFRNELIAARTDASGRHALKNLRLSYYQCSQPPQHRDLKSPQETLDVLQQVFGIATAEVPGIEQQVTRLFTTS